MSDITDDEISKQLADQYVQGPKQWRGKPLAPLTRGLWDTLEKVIIPQNDTGLFWDVALLHVLSLAYSETEAGKISARRSLIKATDDKDGFRASISMLLDVITGEEADDARKVSDEILDSIKKSQAVDTEKKSQSGEEERLQMTTQSQSGSSQESQDGVLITSAGS